MSGRHPFYAQWSSIAWLCHIVFVRPFIHSFIHGWMSGLVPLPGCCAQCCRERKARLTHSSCERFPVTDTCWWMATNLPPLRLSLQVLKGVEDSFPLCVLCSLLSPSCNLFPVCPPSPPQHTCNPKHVLPTVLTNTFPDIGSGSL